MKSSLGSLSGTLSGLKVGASKRFAEAKKLIEENNADPTSTFAMRFYPESLYSDEEFACKRLGLINFISDSSDDFNFYEGAYYWKRGLVTKPFPGTDEYLNYAEQGDVNPVKVNFEMECSVTPRAICNVLTYVTKLSNRLKRVPLQITKPEIIFFHAVRTS